MYDESKTIDGVELLWDTARGKMQSVGRSLVALWLDPSLLHILAPLRDEMGTELFQLLVAHSSSQGAREDYETMVTVFAQTFEEGFVAWGKAVGVVGWGSFELAAIDRAGGTATVIVRSPWELVMQERLAESWGCPFLRGKMIGIFRYALGANCWAREEQYQENGEPVARFELFLSQLTIGSELARLRGKLDRTRAERLQAAVELQTAMHRSSESRLRATLASMNSWVFTLDDSGLIQSHHLPSGVTRSSFVGTDPTGKALVDVLPAEPAALILDAAARVMTEGGVQTVEYDISDASGLLSFGVSVSPLPGVDGVPDAHRNNQQVTVVIHDITQQRRAAEHQRQLEAQLRQAQKMEAIGQLTGGVAHDFNNLLTSIYGNLELVAGAELPADIRECLDEARRAAESAAGLTRQLLAFSRRQPLRPHRVDPRALLAKMDLLMQRTLGERYDVEIVGSAGQWLCEVDGAQLESAILNLVINARDAMPDGGRVTIETGNIRISSEYAAEVDGLKPGQYVMVAVSDTGVGMSEEVQLQAFEPFFTTKGLGRGSGLGLSMVYGFVRQSQGHVKIYSEPNVGTTIKLYIPRSTQTTETYPETPFKGAAPPGDGSKILVVEDEVPVRLVCVRFLQKQGYTTIDCGTAEEALALLRNEKMDLLLTDVVLPGKMNGAALARVVAHEYPHMAVIYTSGYTENAIVHHGRLDPGVQLVEKPFTRDQLGWRVYSVLEAQRSRNGSGE